MQASFLYMQKYTEPGFLFVRLTFLGDFLKVSSSIFVKHNLQSCYINKE